MSLVSRNTRLFWGFFLLASLIAAIVALRGYPLVAPGLSVDIGLSREQALAEAERLHQQWFPELRTNRQAATFVSDRHLQNYVELEAGGLAAFQALIREPHADTHYWRLRRFAEGQQDEISIELSPGGVPISFVRVVPDQAPGAALEESEARTLAETGARDFLGDRFTAYAPLETQSRRQTSGRVDHVFTYEHQHLQAGEARFRLSLRVAGDQLVSVDTYKHVPQAFSQRFAEMRGVNNQIAQVASLLMLGLFGFGGVVLGCFWLYRRHQLRWRAPLIAALVVATGVAAANLSYLPATWMDYQTTDKVSSFLLQQAAQAFTVVLGVGLMLWATFAAAEGLSRMAFAGHVSVFQALRRPQAASPQVAGQVLGGYAWAGFFLLYAVVFILLASRVFGWWMPAGMQSDPNILASWRPALAAIFLSLHAGTWEEALFRAVPLALAVLIGRRFGIERGLVIFTLILQALIFAAAHAQYPQLPGYSRVVELFIPALVFGLVYLRYGLIPCMVSHVIYDLVLFSLPIFTADAPGLWLDRALVILVGVLPLLILARALWREHGWVALPEAALHGQPPVHEAPAAVAASAPSAETPSAPLSLPRPLSLVLAVAGILLMGLLAFKPSPLEWPRFTTDRDQALALAETALRERGVVLEGDWRSSVLTRDGDWWPRQFVWPNSGAAETQQLLGTYLDTPYWLVTWRRFDGPVEERAERWDVWLYPDGRLREVSHGLPEGRPGASLSREEALAVARDWVLALGWPDPATLQEKSVEEIQRPARTDWRIVYLDLAAYDHENGQASIRIHLSGDEVTGYSRSIEVPEAWGRSWSERSSSQTPYRIAVGIVVTVLLILALCGYIGRSTGARFSIAAAWPWMLISVVSMLGVAVLWRHQPLSMLDPTQGWWMQVGIMAFGIGVGAAIQATISFFAAQAVYTERPLPGARLGSDLWLGASLALGIIGLNALFELSWPSSTTPGPYMADWSTDIPWLTTIGNGLKGFFGLLITLVLALGMVKFLKARWRVQLVIALAIVWVIASPLANDEPWRQLVVTLLGLAKILLVYLLIQRSQMGVAMAFLFVGLALGQWHVSRALYPLSWLHALASVLVCGLICYGLLRHWYHHTRDAS